MNYISHIFKLLKSKAFLILLLFFPVLVFSQTLKTEGKIIVDDNNNEVILKGMGLGGWMLMEGYMMQSSDVADSQHEFRNRLIDLMGEEKTNEFFDAWLANHVTKADVDSLASWGYNLIRLPMHYNLFTLPIEDEPIQGENTWLDKGFVMVDSLMHWCELNNIYLILDMHAAPGGQGYNSSISDYDPSKPSLWESQFNRDKTVALWAKLSERYHNSKWLAGYDLLNEVNWTISGNIALKNLYIDITNAIREIDSTHIIFIEGNGYANDFSGLTPPWDDNMAYSFHKYWNYNDQGSVDWVKTLSDQYNVPLWMGEGGENSNVWFHDAISLLENNHIGWSFWPMKRIETIVGPYSIPFTQGYKNVLSYWRNEIPKPSVDDAYAWMMELANNSNSANCLYRKDVHDAQIDQPNNEETRPFAEHSIPGVVFMSDYDMGPLNIAYYDVDNVNYSLSTGQFEAWNSGWVYRNDGVDIETNNDAVNSNGFHIAFIQKNEWTKYTVNIDQSGSYQAIARIASQVNGGKFHLELDDEDITSSTTVNSTGSWTSFDDLIIDDILLTEGTHEITLWFDANNAFNISSIEFVKTGEISDINMLAVNAETLADEKSIELFINQDVLAESITDTQDEFTLTVNGVERPISSVSMTENKNRTIVLNTDDFLVYTDVIKISYQGSSIVSTNDKQLEIFSDLSVRNTLSKRFILPRKIQAEDFEINSGFGLEETSDVGGGQNLGYANPGDYTIYSIFAKEDKYYHLNLRVASAYGNAKLKFVIIDENNQETELTTFDIASTGGWQSWKTISNSVFIPKGPYKLKMEAISGEFNLNWFEFNMIDAVEDNIKGENNTFIYPNPLSNDNVFIVTNNNKSNEIGLNIYSINGQLISSNILYSNDGVYEFNANFIPKGLYILKISTGDNTFNTKLIRQ